MGRKKIGDGWKSRAKQHQKAYVDRRGEEYRAYQRSWKRKNGERLAMRRKVRVYGLSEDEIVRLFVEQGGECAICHTEMALLGHNGAHVDHDHITDEVRGLLCRACNTALGQFDDDPDRLRAALAYLERKKP